jgi:hypothetical protein
MAYMVSDLLNRVRQVLQDEDQNNYRYPTSDLIGYLNDAVTEAYRLRPDLFIGTYAKRRTLISDVPTTDYTQVAFPLPDSCFVPVVGYVVGFTEIRDDEFSNDGRAMTFMTSFTQKLLGVA